MTWLWALLIGGGLYFYGKTKSATAAVANSSGLNAAALNILAAGTATTAADLAALSGGISSIASTGTTLKNLFPSSPSAMATSSTANTNTSTTDSNDGTDGGDDFGTLTDNSVQQPAVSGTEVDDDYDFDAVSANNDGTDDSDDEDD